MKTTYLINSYLPDGSTELVQTTSERWREIIKANKTLPKARQRYFYVDIIRDSNPYDCIIMEVDASRLKEWNNESRAVRRNWSEKKRYSHISLDLLLEECDNCIVCSRSFEEDCVGSVIISELRKALAGWNTWGPAVLDMYISGQKKAVANYLIEEYGLNESAAYRQRKAFEIFSKKFLLG